MSSTTGTMVDPRAKALRDPAGANQRSRVVAVVAVIAGVGLAVVLPLVYRQVDPVLWAVGAVGAAVLVVGGIDRSRTVRRQLAIAEHIGPEGEVRSYEVALRGPREMSDHIAGTALQRTLHITTVPGRGLFMRAMNLGGIGMAGEASTVRLRVGVDDSDGSPVRWYDSIDESELMARQSRYDAGATALVREADGGVVWLISGRRPNVGAPAEGDQMALWAVPVKIVPWWWHVGALLMVFGVVSGQGDPGVGVALLFFVAAVVLLMLGAGRLAFRFLGGWDQRPMVVRQTVVSRTAAVPAWVWASVAVVSILAVGELQDLPSVGGPLLVVGLMSTVEVVAAGIRRLRS